MNWFNQHKYIVRAASLLLLLAAIVGPWVFTTDGVPPAAWCRPPLVLLENDRCVELLSLAAILIFLVRELPSASVEAWPVIVLPFLPTLPFLTTPLLLRGRDSRLLRLFHLMAWGLPAISSLLVLLDTSAPASLLVRLWGIWLYVGLAIGVMVLETQAARAGRARRTVPEHN